MLSQKLFNNPVLLKRSTGLSQLQFQELARRVAPVWNHSEWQRLSGLKRQRAIGAGHPYHLKTIEEKLFCILFWYKIYPAFWLLGMLLGFDASNACKLVVRLRPMIKKAADPQLGFYLRQMTKLKGRKKISSLDELNREFPGILDIFIDSTEQQRLRPKKNVQKRYYSGKKKRHTLKTQLIVGQEGKILALSRTYPGHFHDYDVFRRENTPATIPRKSRVFLDRGYTGVKKDFPSHNWQLPIKRNRWKKALTRSEKITNHKLSKKRVLVEHVISRVKKYAFLSGIFRNRLTYYRDDFRNIAALTNFRLVFTS